MEEKNKAVFQYFLCVYVNKKRCKSVLPLITFLQKYFFLDRHPAFLTRLCITEKFKLIQTFLANETIKGKVVKLIFFLNFPLFPVS
jgi:hypothetical protein